MQPPASRPLTVRRQRSLSAPSSCVAHRNSACCSRKLTMIDYASTGRTLSTPVRPSSTCGTPTASPPAKRAVPLCMKSVGTTISPKTVRSFARTEKDEPRAVQLAPKHPPRSWMPHCSCLPLVLLVLAGLTAVLSPTILWLARSAGCSPGDSILLTTSTQSLVDPHMAEFYSAWLSASISGHFERHCLPR